MIPTDYFLKPSSIWNGMATCSKLIDLEPSTAHIEKCACSLAGPPGLLEFGLLLSPFMAVNRTCNLSDLLLPLHLPE